MTSTQKALIAIYLDYVNNYARFKGATATMAKDNLMTDTQMTTLIKLGQEFYEESLQLSLDLKAL